MESFGQSNGLNFRSYIIAPFFRVSIVAIIVKRVVRVVTVVIVIILVIVAIVVILVIVVIVVTGFGFFHEHTVSRRSTLKFYTSMRSWNCLPRVRRCWGVGFRAF